MTPDIKCLIRARCPVYPSEDPSKVLHALQEALPGAQAESLSGMAQASSDDPSCLEKIRESVRARKSYAAYRRHLEQDAGPDSATLCLNKQAAHAGAIALCGRDEDPPLGMITITLQSARIDELVAWLARPDQNNSPHVAPKF